MRPCFLETAIYPPCLDGGMAVELSFGDRGYLEQYAWHLLLFLHSSRLAGSHQTQKDADTCISRMVTSQPSHCQAGGEKDSMGSLPPRSRSTLILLFSYCCCCWGIDWV